MEKNLHNPCPKLLLAAPNTGSVLAHSGGGPACADIMRERSTAANYVTAVLLQRVKVERCKLRRLIWGAVVV